MYEVTPHRVTQRPGPASKPKPRLSRAAVNFMLDAWMLLNFVVLLWLTMLLNVVFPPPTASSGYSLWGMTYDAWSRLSFGAMVVFTLSILLHLVLHWNWVCSFVRSRVTKWRGRAFAPNPAVNTLYGVTVLIGIFLVGGLLLTLAHLDLTHIAEN